MPLFDYVLVRLCVCPYVSVWIESRSLLCITRLFIVRTNPRYERNPSTTYEAAREDERGRREKGRKENKEM